MGRKVESMLRFIARRLLYVVPVILGVTFIVFFALHLAPGDVTQQILGLFASEQRAAVLRVHLGLDKPVLVQYGIWLWHFFQGDLGVSHVMNAPVLTVLLRKIGNSMILMAGTVVIVVVTSFILGTMSAARFRKPFDRFTVLFTLVLASLPVFWFGLVLLFLFGVHWRLFPTAGMYNIADPGGLPDLLHHLVLPAVTTAAGGLAIMTRVTRGAMIDVLGQPYILAARSRGLSATRVIYKHGVRNVLPQFVNMIGLNIGFLFGGAIFSEIIFTWPGIGLQLYESILHRDAPMVQGCVLAIAVVFVFSNLVADVVVFALDPRNKEIDSR